MSDRKVRMGIDVGGTHTKAVAIDNATHQIIGKSSVKTTHDDKAGVATGVVAAFQNCLRENNIDPKDVIFVAHSTTQATNALIEGDVAKVGVVGVGPKGIGGLIAKAQTNMKDINLGSGRFIRLKNRYICDEKLSDQAVTASGCIAFLAAFAFPYAKYSGLIRPSTLAAHVFVMVIRFPFFNSIAT